MTEKSEERLSTDTLLNNFEKFQDPGKRLQEALNTEH